MTKYRVLVTHDTTESAYIEVEAETPLLASYDAIDKARTEAVGWEVDDGNSIRPYLPDTIDNVVEEIS